MLAIASSYVIIQLLMRKIIINREEKYEKKKHGKPKNYLSNN